MLRLWRTAFPHVKSKPTYRVPCEFDLTNRLLWFRLTEMLLAGIRCLEQLDLAGHPREAQLEDGFLDVNALSLKPSQIS